MAAPKAKRTQPTIPKRKTPNQCTTLDINKKFKFYNTKELSKKILNELAEQIILWVEEDKPKLFFEQFLKEFGIYRSVMELHLVNSEAVRDAKAYAMQVISFYRETKAYQTNYWAIFRHTQGLYDPKWKAQEIYFNQLRQQVAEKTGSGMQTPVLPSVNELGSMANEHDQAQRRREDLAKELSAEILPGTDTKSPGTETL